MRRFVVLILVAGLAVLSACGGSEKAGEQADTGQAVDSGKPASVEEAYKVLIAYLEEDQSTEDALDATLKFLDEYPESKYTEGFVIDVVYYKGEKLGDRKGAVALAEKARGRVDDPEIALKLDKRMLVFYGDAGMKEKMLALADRMDSAGQIKFGDNWNIIEAAVEMEDWALARQYCGKTQEMATAATFRSDWPDYECTDEEAEQAGRNRKGMLLTMDSWALANQGEIDEALAGFASAKEVVRISYLNIPAYNLDLYHARTLVLKGDYQGAIDVFAAKALVMGDEDAATEMKAAYSKLHGSDDGYAAYSKKLHRDVAVKVDGFELPDSDGKRHTFAGLKGDVTFIAFWSPT
jgi:hypothetical protein